MCRVEECRARMPRPLPPTACEEKQRTSPLGGIDRLTPRAHARRVPVLPPAARQTMFHARIVSPRGSLYLAAEATPYDLENLRTHVHDLRAAKSHDTRLELRIDRPSTNAAYQRVSTFLQQLEAEGVQTSFSLSPLA